MIRIALLVFSLVFSAFCQSAITLRGTVTDPDGSTVPGARVLLYRLDTNGRSAAETDREGTYIFERLQPGRFVLELEKSGFRSTNRSIRLLPGSNATMDIALEVEGVAQTVFVTANDAPQTIDEISKAVSVLPGQEIQKRDEFSLAEAIRSIPGVQVQNQGGPGQNTSIRIRGLRADAAAVLVDGLRFRDASTTQGDASSFLSTLNFTGADRVEVLRGSGSSLYGSNAVGGVVNVITNDGGAPTHGDLLVEGGSLGLFRGKASLGGGAWKDRLRYAGSLLHLNVVNGVDGNDANRSTGGQGFVRYDLTPTLNLTGRLWASDDFVQLNSSPTTTGVPTGNFPDQTIIPVHVLSPDNVEVLRQGGQADFLGVTLLPGRDDPDNRRASRFHTTAVILRHALAPRFNWQGSYQRNHTSRVFQNGPAGVGYQPEAPSYGNYVGDIDTFDLRATGLLTPWLSVTGGYEFEREDYFDRQDNNLQGTSRVATETSIGQHSSAAYFASQLSMLDRRLQINASGRAQFFSLSRPEFKLTGAANNYDRVPLNAPPDALTGDLAVSYFLPATNTKFRAHAGNAYRSPSLYERFGGGFGSDPVSGAISFTPYGDPRLSPDRYNNVDAGIDQYFFSSKVRASATWFYSRVITITGFDSSGGINPSTDPYGRFIGYINGSGGISRGFELGIEAQPTRSTLVNFAYTNVNADQDRDLNVAGFFKVLRVQDKVSTVVVSQDWTSRFNTTVDVLYGSGYYDSYYAAGRSRAFLNPSYTKVDLVGSYRVWQGEKGTARLFAKVENLFDRRYYQSGYLAAGATGLVGLNYRF